MFRIFWFLVICSWGHRYVDGQHQGQRIAPGIPPQHYQQQQNHGGQQQMQQQIPQQQMYQQQQQPQQQQQQQQQQQMHQQQQQFQQQVPVQHVPVQQQVPMQQHQQVPQQHVPVQHQGGHNHDHNSQNLLNANVAQEKAHIVEHLDVPMDTSKMTDQELQFHYFKMHDADNNNKLDGCELIKSLFHWHEHGNADSGSKEKVFTDDELVNLIDPILSMDDINKDGYIDYTEFIKAQQKAVAEGRQ